MHDEQFPVLVFQLDERDAWNCAGCGQLQACATKRLGLWSTPDILVVHLKRFRHVSGLCAIITSTVSALCEITQIRQYVNTQHVELGI